MNTCMGGWCRIRDKCKHNSPSPHRAVSERLCAPGQANAFQPRYAVPIYREKVPA